MFIELPDHRAHVVSFGHGPLTLFALPGWIAGWEAWEGPLERLSARYRCLAMDPRGGGESNAPLESITTEAVAGDVLAVMDALGIERCVLMGESMGALASLCAASRAPERFQGLVLVSPILEMRASAAAMAAGALRDWPATAALFAQACFPEPNTEHEKRWGQRILVRATGAAAARMIEQMLEAPVRVEPARLSLPTLIVHGTADAIVPHTVAAALARQIPRAQFELLEGIGHAPTMSCPERLATLIEGWLARALT